jgi:hypothetical protein
MHDKLEDNLTPKAKKIWQAIPADIRLKILNNVWCVQCKAMTGQWKDRIWHAGAKGHLHPMRR